METKFCPQCKSDKPKEGFKSKLGKETKNCEDCLEKSRKWEARRAPRKRDYRKYDQREDVKIRKKKWREDNPEKTKAYYTEFRKRKREEDEEAYLKHNAEVMASWRKENPDKIKAIQEKSKSSHVQRLTTYKWSASQKNYTWDLEDEYAIELMKDKCWYCGEFDERGLGGIDRIDSSKGYTEDNVVSCCKMCNYMKERWSQESFVALCGHISSMLNGEGGPFIGHRFTDSCPSSYVKYSKRASNKKITFCLTLNEYEDLIKNPCYICGQMSDEYNINGIDRIDNNKGYTIENSASCCSTCNKLKKNYTLEKIAEQTKKIWYNSSSKVKFENGILYKK